MTQKKLAEEAYKQVQDELSSEQLGIIKDAMLKTLRAIDNQKEVVAKEQEKLRVLKLDLEDLQAGKLDKIKERQAKSQVACKISVIQMPMFDNSIFSGNLSWPQITSGTYYTGTRTYYL